MERLRESAEETLAGFNVATEEKLETAMLNMFYSNVTKDQHPKVFTDLYEEYKGDWKVLVNNGMKLSVFTGL